MKKEELDRMNSIVSGLQKELYTLNRKRKNIFFKFFASNIDRIALDEMIYKKQREIDAKNSYLTLLEQEGLIL